MAFMDSVNPSHGTDAYLHHTQLVKPLYLSQLRCAGADPGFPVGRGTNLRERGGVAPTYNFAKFSEKLHGIENIFSRTVSA